MLQTATRWPQFQPTLKNSLLSTLSRGLLAEPEAKTTIDPQYIAYQNDPVGFGEKFFNETYTDDIKLVMESVRDNPVTLVKSANGTGKTHGAARVAAWFYKTRSNVEVYTTAAPPSETNLELLLWGEIGTLMQNHPAIFSGDLSSSLHIERHAKEFITGVTIPSSGTSAQRVARFSGKHAPNMLFIVDEGDAVPAEVYTGIESCMSGGNARLLILFNPRMKAGPLAKMELGRQANVIEISAFNHPNVVTGENIYPGAVDRATTVRRINDMARPLAPGEEPDNNCFVLPDFLVGCVGYSKANTPYPPLRAGTYKVTDDRFNFMTLARYPAQASNQLISQEWLDAAHARYRAWQALYGDKPPVGVKPRGGLDVAEMGDDANVLCLRYGSWVAPMISWSGVDVLVTGDKAAGYFTQYDMSELCVDALGVGSGVAPHVRRKLGAKGRATVHAIKTSESPTERPTEKEMGEFGNLRDQLWWAMREWLRTDKTAMLPPDDALDEELLTATYGPDTKGYIKVLAKDKMKPILGRSPDRADALANTFAPAKPAFRIDLA